GARASCESLPVLEESFSYCSIREPSPKRYRIPWCLDTEPSTGSLYSNSSAATTSETSDRISLINLTKR
ncbi:hypothetical protein U9M48_010308, partial [Paspalum notatum var. saurae]